MFRSRDSSEAQRVGDDGNGGQRHGRPRDHGREQEAEHRIKDARRDWDADHVEQEREGEIMPDIAHRVVRRLPRTDPGTETAMRERDARALDGNVRPRAHRNADGGGCERGCGLH